MATTFSITYAGVTIGGSSAYYLLHCDEGEAPMRLSKSNDTFTLEAYVVCRSTSVSDFTTKADALEVAFRTLAGDLSYTFGSSTTSFSQSSNTGMNARPRIEKPGSLKFDTDRSRLYRISVSLTLPADATGKNGLREGSITITTEDTGRLTASITGTVTALSSASAYAQAATCIAGLVSDVTTALSVTMQAIEPRFIRYDDRNKVATFQHTLREILSAESSAGLDHASITTQQFTIERDETYPGDHDGHGPPVRLAASYAAGIAKSVTDLPSFWESTIKPWILSRLRSVAASGSFAVIDIKPSFDVWNNRIGASVSMLACVATTWGRRITTETDETTALRSRAVWNGNPFARTKSQGAATRRLTITETIVRLGGSSGGPGGNASGALGGFGFNGGGSAALGQLGGVSFGFFGSQFQGRDQRSQLGQLNVGGGAPGASQAPASTGLGGVKVPKGYELVHTYARSYPETVGGSDGRYLTTNEYRTETYEYMEPVAPGSGGGPGAGSVGTTIR